MVVRRIIENIWSESYLLDQVRSIFRKSQEYVRVATNLSNVIVNIRVFNVIFCLFQLIDSCDLRTETNLWKVDALCKLSFIAKRIFFSFINPYFN